MSAAPLSGFSTPVLTAIVEILFLAAFADGEFSADERAHFKSSVESLTDRQLAGEAFDTLIAGMEKALESEGRPARLAAVRQRLPDERQRKIALQMAIRLTATDGIIRTSEREMILEAAEALGIDGDAAADLVARVGT
ncbi:MAG: TerB family tellurite resistance protein [Myxococcales bacterium]|nr:TerB family tellurite resistance protein [Myxococcales bacterium]MBL8716193.1 TerB family tellurite resistance protein [Myxococcales bacterium]